MAKKDKPKKKNSLESLRSEIDQLEKKITERKRKERIMLEEGRDVKSIYEWKAPERPFNPKSRSWYIAVSGVALFVILLSVLTQTYVLVVAVLSVLVVVFAMNSIVPPVFDYEITNKGLRAGEKLYPWRQIPTFWITQRGENVFLNFETTLKNEKRLMLLVGDGNMDIIATELIKYIDYLTPEETPGDLFSNFTEGKHRRLEDIYNLGKKDKKAANNT